MIDSPRNPLIRWLRSLGSRRRRAADRAFVIEGVRFVEAALDAGAPVSHLFVRADFAADPRVEALVARARRAAVQVHHVSERVAAAASDLQTPPGVLAVVEAGLRDAGALLAADPLRLLVCDGIQDPGNLGAIIRAADAAGASGVAVTSGAVDPLNPKTLRASMGSIFHLPVGAISEAAAFAAALRDRGARILVADAAGAAPYTEVSYEPPVALVVGSEAHGVSRAFRAAADQTVRIPIRGRAESLNAAQAAAVLLYAMCREA